MATRVGSDRRPSSEMSGYKQTQLLFEQAGHEASSGGLGGVGDAHSGACPRHHVPRHDLQCRHELQARQRLGGTPHCIQFR